MHYIKCFIKTTELEQEFFKVFGIKHKCKRGKIVCAGRASNKCPTCQNNIYPEITDRILLELICIAYKTQGIELTIEDIKNEVLNNCIKYKDDIKLQIQQLFKEEE